MGWIVLLQPASRGPTPGWSLAHAVLLVGVAFFIPAVLGMGSFLRAAQAREGCVAVRLVLVGALTLGGQYAIDLAAAPALAIASYTVGPAGLYVGLYLSSVETRRPLPSRDAGLTLALV